MIHAFLIADSDIYGKDQVISRTIKYPWASCSCPEDFEKANNIVIANALAFAKEYGYTNIREVRTNLKQVWKHGCWQNVQVGKQRVVPFKHQS